MKGGRKPKVKILRQERRIIVPMVCTDDRVDRWMEECCELDASYRQATGELAESFCHWCQANGYKRVPFGYLGYHLSARGYQPRASGRVVWRYGIRVRSGSHCGTVRPKAHMVNPQSKTTCSSLDNDMLGAAPPASPL